MFKMENRKIDRKPPSTLKQGKQGIFRVINQSPSNTNKVVSKENIPLVESKSVIKNKDNQPADNVAISPAKKAQKKIDDSSSSKKNTPRSQKSPQKVPDRVIDQPPSSPQEKDNSASKAKQKFLNEMDDNAPLILMTWVGRKVNVQNVKKSLKELATTVEKILPKGTLYSCCENFDTYLTGGLYPILHMTTDKEVIANTLSNQEFMPTETLGDNNMIEQAVYTEIASVTPPGDSSKRNSTAIAVAGFRSTEPKAPEILLREWKSWTGSRGFMLDILQAGLTCVSVKFYVKKEPIDDHSSFFYVVTTEVAINEPNEEGLFVDILQKFRVERFLGFRTIYRIYDMDT